MSNFYQYDTRGASYADQIVNLERMVKERDAQIERLREAHDAVWDILRSTAKESHDEIERLREENSTFSDSLAANADRIDRLGETVVRLRTELRERMSQDVLDDALEEWKKEVEQLRLERDQYSNEITGKLMPEIERLRKASSKVVKQFWEDRQWLMQTIEELEKVLGHEWHPSINC